MTMNNVTLTAPVELEAESTVGESATPRLPRFRMVAYTGATMRLSGWRYPVIIDLAGLRIPSQRLPIRFGHDSFHGVGHTEQITIEGGQLLASGVLSRDTAVAREVAASARNGFPWQASIGASVEQYEHLKDGQTALVNGQSVSGNIIVVRQSTLHEISFVDIGADNRTTASVEAQLHEGSHHMEEQEPTTQPVEAAAEAATELQQAVEQAKTQQTITEIVQAAVAQHPHAIGKLEQIAARAHAERWDAQRIELEVLRATRPVVQPAATSREVVMQQGVLEAALCLAAGVKDDQLAADRDYGPRTVEAAWKLRSAGLCGILSMALQANGYRVPYGREELYRTLQQACQVQASGFSTINLPGLLGNVANKLLLQSFTNQPTTYQLIAQQVNVSNFHTHSIYRLDHTQTFKRVAPTGELEHTTLVEDAYTNRVETYGIMVTLARTHIVNDELDAFQGLVANIGASARAAIERALYAQVMEATDNFYTAARGNRLTSSALSITTLGQARAALMKMTDAGGNPLNTDGRYLVVPPELEPLANQIFTSQTVMVTTTADRERPVTNYYVNRYIPVTSAFLSTGTGSGQSPTTWYLVADPSVLPAFQVAFLNGQRTPVIETSDAPFHTLGLQMRAYWDFGVARIDHRGAVKATA